MNYKNLNYEIETCNDRNCRVIQRIRPAFYESDKYLNYEIETEPAPGEVLC